MGIKDALGKLGGGILNSNRIVADSDKADYDSLHGKNIKLENARREARKFKEKEELSQLQQYLKEKRDEERKSRWTDNGGFIHGSDSNQFEEKKLRPGQTKAGLFSGQSFIKARGKERRGLI